MVWSTKIGIAEKFKVFLNWSSLLKTLHEQKNFVLRLFLTYDINSIRDSCGIVPIIPSTWLARKYPS